MAAWCFSITERGPYNPEELAHITATLQYAGSIVQDAYEFERDISVQVQFFDFWQSGGGANGGAAGVYTINETSYPNALAKQNFSAEEWAEKNYLQYD